MDTIIKYIYLVLGFLPLILYFFLYKRKGDPDKSLVNFLSFIVLMFLATIVELNLFKFNVKNWIRLYDFLEFSALLIFFYRELRLKKIYILFASGYFLLLVYLLFTWNNEKIGDQPLMFSTVLLVLISSVLWFVNVFKNFEEKPLYKRTSFYLVSVVLLYILGTSLSFISTDFFWKHNRENSYILKRINYFFNILSRIIIIITIYKSFESKRRYSLRN